MSNWKEIKRRIKSVKNTSKITKAMELISTVKMKKAVDWANEKKEYMRWILDVFLKVSDSLWESQFFRPWIWKKTLAIIVTSNKWLCWGYNVNVMKKVRDYTVANPSKEIEFISIWKRWAQFVARTWNNLVFDYSNDFTDNIEYSFSKDISKDVTKKFLSWDYSEVVVFYSHFVNTIKQIPVSRVFLPLTKVWIENYFKQVFGWDYYKEKEALLSWKLNYTIEPSKEELLKHIVPLILDSIFFDILLESKASEHASRMIAMKNAKDNANKFASSLTLEYNKARQAAITKEVSEIVSGVESMKDS